MENYDENLINAKYHLSIAKRLLENYPNFEEKRFLIGIIREAAISTSHLIQCFLIFEKKDCKNAKKNVKTFLKEVAPRYLDKTTTQNLKKILEVGHAEKNSPIEFSKKDKVILLISGKYKFISFLQLKEFLDSLNIGLKKFKEISGRYKKVYN